MTDDARPLVPILDAALAMEIGELIATWSSVTWFFTILLGELMIGRPAKEDDDPTYSLVLIGMDARVQIAMIKTLLRSRLGEAVAAPIDKILERLERIKRVRDNAAHGIWEQDEKTGRMYARTLKATHRAKISRVHYSAERIHSFTVGLNCYAEKLIAAVQPHGYMADLKPWHGKYL